jgi:hypothetical protein
VASQSTFSQTSQEYVRSPVHLLDHEVESRDEEGVSRDFDDDFDGEEELGPSGSGTQKKRRCRGASDVPKEEPAPADRPVISPSGNE